MNDAIPTLPPFLPPMHEVLARQAAADPGRVILDFESRQLTLAELDSAANVLAQSLLAGGLEPGGLVAVMLGNRAEMCIAQYAIARAGAVIVPVSTAMRGDPLARYFTDSGAATAIVEAGLLERVEHALGGRAGIRRLITLGGGASDSERLEDLLEQHHRVDLPSPRPGDLWAVMYTSGTTGPAKGVMLSHHFLSRQVQTVIEIMLTHERSVIFNPAPLYHLQAIAFALNSALVTGCRALIRSTLPRGDIRQELNALGVTQAVLPPFVPLAMLQAARTSEDRQGSLETVATIGLTAEQWTSFEVRFGCRMVGLYGPTETGIVTRFLHDGADRRGTSGRRSPHMEVEVVDAHDRVLPAGQVGEVVCRSKFPEELMQGYFRMPEKTLEACRNLWLHTGDAGWFDAEGHFYFADRLKDMIKRRGYSISSFDVEQALLKHAAVVDVAVVPKRDEAGDEEVRAFIVPAAGVSPDCAELVAFANARLAHYMVPRYIDVVESLPRNQLGKVEKFRLREQPLGPATFDRKSAGVELQR